MIIVKILSGRKIHIQEMIQILALKIVHYAIFHSIPL